MKLLYSVFGKISDEAFCILSGTLKVVCTMLICSLAILRETGRLRPDTYRLYYLASQLESNAAGVIVVGNFAALLLERTHGR